MGLVLGFFIVVLLAGAAKLAFKVMSQAEELHRLRGFANTQLRRVFILRSALVRIAADEDLSPAARKIVTEKLADDDRELLKPPD